jgi:integrase
MANAKGKGWLRCKQYAQGQAWLYCFRLKRASDGKLVENGKFVGYISKFPTEADAWMEVGRLGLDRLIDKPEQDKLKFGELAKMYRVSGAIQRKGLTGKKASGTTYTISHNLDAYCLPRWRDIVVTEITPKGTEQWLTYLHEKEKLDWSTITKIRQAFNSTIKYGRKEQFLPDTFDPLRDVECDAGSDYEAVVCTPEQTLAILSKLDGVLWYLTLLIAATGLRISEALALRWSAIDYERHCIHVKRTWTLRELKNKTKSKASRASSPLCPVLAKFMQTWRCESPFSSPADYVFPSLKLKGKQPLTGSIAAQNYLRPAAISAGVLTVQKEKCISEKGEQVSRLRYFDHNGGEVTRWGWHNLRHSLATYLVEQGEDVKTVQGILRHASPQTTMGIYAHVVPGKAVVAQGKFLSRLLTQNTATDSGGGTNAG